MSQGPLLLWLVMQFGWIYLVPTASEDTVTSFLGQSVTLPCLYLSWSQDRNSMCWGKGHCPNSKCSQALLHTDGSRVLSSASEKYRLLGNIQRGHVSLTISNTNEEDSGVYCCRIEVPGWFNDVKKHIRLVLSRAPTTTRKMTTLPPTTTPHMTTTTVVLPTTAVTTPDLTTRTPLQTKATSGFTTSTTCPLTTMTSLPEVATSLLTTGPSTEGPVLTTESATFRGSSASWRSIKATSADTASSMAKASEMTSPTQSKSKENRETNLVVMVASCLGFVLLVLVATFLLRGKVTKTSCLQKHKRLDKQIRESKNALNDMHRGQDDEDGLFTL
ncbi:T-cell immunoglobulin and mucin domain-containing protein 4 isoform X3 [Marmota marmota marmota]|uniref:T-cell immunoglobulin and mucin domain-containing protein 4 isoform X3 n=1 Tax=Marmota marmota marmota TaxID=9994 RepID=UPI0007626862|nr:T-cell immunoglobulin and mucin domain-containing protein 4 isoform X3 [Marmota marmota marmota]